MWLDERLEEGFSGCTGEGVEGGAGPGDGPGGGGWCLAVGGSCRGEKQTHVTSTGSTVKGSAQCSQNMVTMVSSTMWALVRSVAVTSMKTSVVASVMREWRELIMGGNEQTTPFVSRITGYSGSSLMIGTYLTHACGGGASKDRGVEG